VVEFFCAGNSSPILENVTISRNSAKYWGGAVYSEDYSNPTLTDAILWNNFPHEIRLLRGTVTIEYSDIKGGKGGISNDTSNWLNEGTINWLEGNIDANPLFCDPLNKHIQSQRIHLVRELGKMDSIWVHSVLAVILFLSMRIHRSCMYWSAF